MIHQDGIRAALYARVSSEQQAQAHTIASQTEALQERMKADGLNCEPAMCFTDEGYSGGTLVRPALERLRDLAAMGGLDRLYVHSPDRLARHYAYQVLLVDEFKRLGVELIFLNHPIGTSPEADLLLQVQGMIAEYERAKILERSRRGKRHAARCGSVSAIGAAPYGYRYIRKDEAGGQAGYQVVLEEARVVQQIFDWVGRDRVSLHKVGRRLADAGVASPRGRSFWDRSTVWGLLKNPAYKGLAALGRTRVGERRPRLRPARGQSEQPRYARSVYDVPEDEWLRIPVPAIVSEEVFEAAAEQLAENRVRHREQSSGARYLLSGLVVCGDCGHAFRGMRKSCARRTGHGYYRCLGLDGYRYGGHPVCENRRSVRTDLLEQAVWADVCSLLNEPERIEREYQRRLEAKHAGTPTASSGLTVMLQRVRRGIARLIDGYENGWLEADEFEGRIRRAREHLRKLEAQAKIEAQRDEEVSQLRLVIGRLQEFADKMKRGLEQTDWPSRREIVRALIKRVEITPESVRVVYRVSPSPGVLAASPSQLSHCRARERFAPGYDPLPLPGHASSSNLGRFRSSDASARSTSGTGLRRICAWLRCSRWPRIDLPPRR